MLAKVGEDELVQWESQVRSRHVVGVRRCRRSWTKERGSEEKCMRLPLLL